MGLPIERLAIVMSATCQATNRDGTPCRMKPSADGFCFQHSPARADERAAACRRGGLARARAIARATLNAAEIGALALRTPEELRELLARTIGHTLTGKLDTRIAATVGTLAGVLLKAQESGELAERLAALEALVRTRGAA